MRRFPSWLILLWLMLLAAALAGCASGSGAETEADDYIAIPPGKADNYLSPVAQEYDVQGEVRLELSEEDAALSGQERQEKVDELVESLVNRTSGAMESKLNELFPKEDRKDADGVIVMLREASTGSDDLQPDGEAAYQLTFRAEVAGTHNLLPFDEGSTTLPVEVGFGDDAQQVELHFSPSPSINDTYPRYRELLSDGLEIYVHYGGDYNDRRWDIVKSKALFDKLKAMGYAAPEDVESYDDLKLDSGPFTGELDLDGEKVAVRIKVVHPEMVSDEDEDLAKLVDAYKKHVTSADVVIYSGHASESTSYSGIVVHYNPRKALPADEFKNLDLPEKYQVFVFSGCYTYTGYADQMFLHPKKNADNLDVVTAVAATPLSRDIVHTLLKGLLDHEPGTWMPHTWTQLLKRINSESERSWRGVFGVHGLESNPKISPLAVPETIGQLCESSSKCPGIDNLCVRTWTSIDKRCGAACTDSSGCPDGSKCWWSFSQDTFRAVRQCVKVR